MPSKTSLPETYEEYRHLDFSRESMAYLSNNLLTAVMLIFFFVIFSAYTRFARTDFTPVEFLSLQGWEILWIFVLAVVMMFAHEGVHWLSFKLLGADDAVFMVKAVSPHALAANTYFKKFPYILTRLAPTLILSAVYLLLALVIPLSWVEMAIYFFAGNVAYATTDLIAIVETIRAPRNVLIKDVGEHVYFSADKEVVKKLRAKKSGKKTKK